VARKDVTIAIVGHTCLDIIPAFTIKGKAEQMTDVLVPGKMINMGQCVVVAGGPVTNAGVSISRLGVKSELIGKVGDDDFGKLVVRWYDEHERHFRGIRMVKGESTSYTVAVCIPGVDRFYLHHCGANDTFGYRDVDFGILKRSKLALFGYPPWMKKLYSRNGLELKRILKETKSLKVTTALDLSIPDVEGYGDKVDWRACMKHWIPLTDVMVPSAEEIFYFLRKKDFLKMKRKIGAGGTVLDEMSVSLVSSLADEMLALGGGIAMVKCGHRGLYVRTAGEERLARFGAAACGNLSEWADRELWFPVYREEKFVGALGSGDSAIAGFLAAFVREMSLEDCLRYGNAAGSMNVTVPDGLSWNKGFSDLTRRIKAGWKVKPMKIAEKGWRRDGQFWAGPDDKG